MGDIKLSENVGFKSPLGGGGAGVPAAWSKKYMFIQTDTKSQLKNKGTSPRYSETYAYKFYAVLL